MATVQALDGFDYKGRYAFVLSPADGAGEDVTLSEIRWNSERTARRTLETMAVKELRRRLNTALGRSALAPTA